MGAQTEDGRFALIGNPRPGIIRVSMGHSDTPVYGQEKQRASAMVREGFESAPTANTNNLHVQLKPQDLSVHVSNDANQPVLKLIPREIKQAWKTIEIETDAEHAYGFGEYPRGTRTDTPWIGWNVRSDGEHGNAMVPFYGGVNTYTQFPVAYGLRKNGEAFAVFVDSPRKVEWDLTEPGKWKVHTSGDDVRIYVMTGKDLPEVRKKYMDLTGKPPVPPRSVFGTGISKFGYRNWDEVDKDIAAMNKQGMPVDMVGLDLQWFGGNFIHHPHGERQFTRMGTLTPDEKNFPNFEQKVAELKKKGVNVMLISESYVNLNLPEARMLEKWGCIVKDEQGKPIVFENKWWGTGYMIDWTHPASAQWVREKYVPLARMGVRNFWLDLGEPEAGLYAPNGRYHGIKPGENSHADVHNIYNLMWAKRFNEVMAQEMPEQRFYTMNRSGTSGLQRFGAGKWGGDVGVSVAGDGANGFHPGDVPELIAHFQNRITNLPMTGIDYYTSDVGGFHRWALGGNAELRDKTYTLWYANSSLLDAPFRPHLWIKEGENRYLPTHTGHVPSNIANTRLRGELEPYYYQAAHRANREGEPIIAPLVYHYGSDPNVRQMGHEAMIGRDLLMGVVGNVNEKNRSVYLPSGGWYDFHTGQHHQGDKGRWVNDVPLYQDGNFRVPLYAREGSIIAMNRINEQGGRVGGETELRVRVFAGDQPTKTRIIEDEDTKPLPGLNELHTVVRQEKTPQGYAVTMEAPLGRSRLVPAERAQRVELVVPEGNVARVVVNGREAGVVKSEAELTGDSPKVFIDLKRRIAIVYQPPRVVGLSSRWEFEVK